jgi:hypothetical protein
LEAHSFICDLLLNYPNEQYLKFVSNTIVQKKDAVEIRYRVAYYLFLLSWKLEDKQLKKSIPLLEGCLRVLSNDTSSDVLDVTVLILVTLEYLHNFAYKKIRRGLEPTFIDILDAKAANLCQVIHNLLDALSKREFDSMYAILQICPLYPKSLETYLESMQDLVLEQMSGPDGYGEMEEQINEERYDDEDPEEYREEGTENMDYVAELNLRNTVENKLKKYKKKNRKDPTIEELPDESKNSSTEPYRTNEKILTSSMESLKSKYKTKFRPKSLDPFFEHMLSKGQKNELTPKTDYEKDLMFKNKDKKVLTTPSEMSNIKIEANPNIPLSNFKDGNRFIGAGNHEYCNSNDEYLRLNPDSPDYIPQLIRASGTWADLRRREGKCLENDSIILLLEDILLFSRPEDFYKFNLYINRGLLREIYKIKVLGNFIDALMFYLNYSDAVVKRNILRVVTLLCEHIGCMRALLTQMRTSSQFASLPAKTFLSTPSPAPWSSSDCSKTSSKCRDCLTADRPPRSSQSTSSTQSCPS